MRLIVLCLAACAAFVACSGGGGTPSGGGTSPTAGPSAKPTTAGPTPTPAPTATPTPAPTATPGPPTAAPINPQLVFLNGANNCSGANQCFYGQYVALPGTNTQQPQITTPRQLAMLPNGDLIVGTGSGSPGAAIGSSSAAIYIIPSADGDPLPGTPAPFATIPDSLPQGVTYSAKSTLGPNGAIYVGATHGVYAIPYTTGMKSAPSGSITKIFQVREPDIQSGCNPPLNVTANPGGVCNGDADDHETTSVLADDSRGVIFVSVGSSCNACAETDPSDTRAVVMEVPLSGDVTSMIQGQPPQNTKWIAKRYRNALALAQNPQTSNVWAGGAGQDCLEPSPLPTVPSPNTPMPRSSCPAQPPAPYQDVYASNGHPYEHLDPLTIDATPAATYSSAPDYGWPDCEENHAALYRSGVTCSKSTQILPAIEYLPYGTIIGAVFYPLHPIGIYQFGTGFKGALFFSGHGSWHEDANGHPVTPPEVAYATMSQGGDLPLTSAQGNNFNSEGQWSPFLSNYQQPNGAMAGNRIGQPVGLAVGPQGSLFVADSYMNAVYRIRYGAPPAASAVRRRYR
jgi:glucose/arabinose dehydrogenase